MQKKDLLNQFNVEEKNLVSSLYNKYVFAYNRGIVTFGNSFYTPNIWQEFLRLFNSKDFCVEADGLFDIAARRMISFNNYSNQKYPYDIITIENKSKFQKLVHRDYLGALLSLGIKREKMGDLLVVGDRCYVPVCEEITEFILMNLKVVKRAKCLVSVVLDRFSMPKVEFEEELILVPSLRIDSVVSKITHLSRAKAQELIEQGKVLVSYAIVKDKSIEVLSDTCITIRGYGKYIIGDVVGNSKSGKVKIIIKKYT